MNPTGSTCTTQAFSTAPRRGESAYGEIGELTEVFRRKLAAKHEATAQDTARELRALQEAWIELHIHGVVPDDLRPFHAANADREKHYEKPWTLLEWLEERMRGCKTKIRWHIGHMFGQVDRIENLIGCGTRILKVACGGCGEVTKEIPEPCSIRRLCERCALYSAKIRRGRFGRGRGRLLLAAQAHGLLRNRRDNGKYLEKMLTLTAPHGTLAGAKAFTAARSAASRSVKGHVATDARARDDISARILAIYLAWPKFARKMATYWKKPDTKRRRPEHHVAYHRAFEWTPGRDGAGHPHFHVYHWSPFLSLRLVKKWWAEALISIGWPVKEHPRVRNEETGKIGPQTYEIQCDLRVLKDFDTKAVRELMKGGRREALTLSRVEKKHMLPRISGENEGPGMRAFDYADGWSIGDVVEECPPAAVSRLYMALEGRRLSQASRGFFLDEPPAECPCCGGVEFQVRFETPTAAIPRVNMPPYRGPPS